MLLACSFRVDGVELVSLRQLRALSHLKLLLLRKLCHSVIFVIIVFRIWRVKLVPVLGWLQALVDRAHFPRVDVIWIILRSVCSGVDLLLDVLE